MSKLSLSSCSHGPNMNGHRGIMEEFSTCYQMIELVLGHATPWPPGFSPFTNRKFMVHFYFNFRRAFHFYCDVFSFCGQRFCDWSDTSPTDGLLYAVGI